MRGKECEGADTDEMNRSEGNTDDRTQVKLYSTGQAITILGKNKKNPPRQEANQPTCKEANFKIKQEIQSLGKDSGHI